MIKTLHKAVVESIKELYDTVITTEEISIQKTKKEFEGDFTLVVFPFTKLSKKKPELTAEELSNKLKEKTNIIASTQIIKGFLNITFHDEVWIDFLKSESKNHSYASTEIDKKQQPVLIEFSSPNTNKPLHLGHVRNNLLGDSISRILSANGTYIYRINLVNDRGIHICKSMLAWQKKAQNETPESSGLKGDKLVGEYYVAFDKLYKKEIEELLTKGITKEEAEKQAPILLQAQDMLLKWESGDEEIYNLWQKMNQWVYQGFDETYKKMGISFDKTYYESETYLLGKEVVLEGLSNNIFYQAEDGSVRVNLENEGLDEKVLLRSDGTSVYMTQDLGTAVLRAEEYNPAQMIYVVGNEQNYHFEALKLILTKKLNYKFTENIFHLSYGMVELPSGKMKSREGTVVDADDLMTEIIEMAKQKTQELGKNDFTEEELQLLAEKIGLGALKYFILKVDPKKNMLFNPDESIDLNGNTGPFIQYTHARICSLIRKSKTIEVVDYKEVNLLQLEKEILLSLYSYPETIKQAAKELNPSVVANFIYDLVKNYNRFYQEIPILKETDTALRSLRLDLSIFTAYVIRHGMSLLGIDVPEKM